MGRLSVAHEGLLLERPGATVRHLTYGRTQFISQSVVSGDEGRPRVVTVECGYAPSSTPWPLDLEAWGRKLYPGPRGMFGIHHHPGEHQVAGLHHHHHHHHQPRGPVTGLKEEPLSSTQLAAARAAWMQPSVVDQSM